MKKSLVIWSITMFTLFAAFAMAGCDRNKNSNSNSNSNSNETSGPHVQTDSRSDAYTAYDKDGSKIGDYKSIAAAINAAVATDSFTADNSIAQLGSYVTTIEGVKVFQNRNGYAEASDDQFWFYEGGTALEAYDCYAGTFYSDILKNSKNVVYSITSRGSLAQQFHNGYAILKQDGTLETELNAQAWELSSTMDAAVLQMPNVLKGITGMSYELDMSNVKITPPYEGMDPVYAFMGFYAWQDYYVITIGVACDTSTGNWYPFEATSRDNSFSDAIYTISEEPLMKSDWNEAEGCWIPQYPTITMDAKTIAKEDDLGKYCVGEMNFNFLDKEGKVEATYSKTIDDETVNQFFSGYPFGAENSYVFVAGLDIRNAGNGNGVNVLCTDYANGAKFENLTMTKATAHVASEEELSQGDYGYEIPAEWRGKDFNILMAAGGVEESILKYTLLNGYAFTEYEAKNGTDVYSFRFDGSNSSENPLGGKAAEYQAIIDQLKGITADNTNDYTDIMSTVAAIYGLDGTGKESSVAQMYYNVLDFTSYFAAKDLFAENAKLSAEGEEFKAAFNALPSLTTYQYTDLDTLYNDLNNFASAKAKYDTLSDADKNQMMYHINMDDYNWYVDMYDKFMNGYYDGITISAKVEGTELDSAEFTGAEAVAEIILYTQKVAAGTAWGANNEDQGNGSPWNDDGNVGGSNQFNSDNNWLPSYHVFYLKARLEEAGKELPNYVSALIASTPIGDGLAEDFAYLHTMFTLASGIESGAITGITEEMAAMINAHIVGKTTFIEPGLAWNYNNHPEQADFLYRDKSFKLYYGLNPENTTLQYIQLVHNFLTEKAGAEVDGIGITKEVVVTP